MSKSRRRICRVKFMSLFGTLAYNQTALPGLPEDLSSPCFKEGQEKHVPEVLLRGAPLVTTEYDFLVQLRKYDIKTNKQNSRKTRF